ncbi:uncharacterized protein LOC126894121 [Daktulosphaira vitifoliae]|uniref:uncharacterized protein LOC126894121 n=1 Tax=Daktulosphaira vitifoliae TaxID=58002 RepID=UPI0021AAC502|nr:uncharacterized protein LOC126894121 [Daktulosphaira vitifoliae]
MWAPNEFFVQDCVLCNRVLQSGYIRFYFYTKCCKERLCIHCYNNHLKEYNTCPKCNNKGVRAAKTELKLPCVICHEKNADNSFSPYCLHWYCKKCLDNEKKNEINVNTVWNIFTNHF